MKRTILIIGLVLLLMVSSGCMGEKATETTAPDTAPITQLETSPPEEMLGQPKLETIVVPSEKSVDHRFIGDSPSIDCDTYPPKGLFVDEVVETARGPQPTGVDAYVMFNNLGGPGKITVEGTWEKSYVISSKSKEFYIDEDKQYVLKVSIYYRSDAGHESFDKYYLKINSSAGLAAAYSFDPIGQIFSPTREITDIEICSERDL